MELVVSATSLMFLAYALRLNKERKSIGPTEALMATETQLFYVVLVVILTLVIHLIFTTKGPQRGGKSHH
jgi:hypothetical protein